MSRFLKFLKNEKIKNNGVKRVDVAVERNFQKSFDASGDEHSVGCCVGNSGVPVFDCQSNYAGSTRRQHVLILKILKMKSTNSRTNRERDELLVHLDRIRKTQFLLLGAVIVLMGVQIISLLCLN